MTTTVLFTNLFLNLIGKVGGVKYNIHLATTVE